MRPKIYRTPIDQAADNEVDFIPPDQNRVIDERGRRSAFGVMVGVAMSDVYEMAHDDERRFDEKGDSEGYIRFPE